IHQLQLLNKKPRPIQQASFESVTYSTTMMASVTTNSTNHTISSDDILQKTLKQSTEFSIKTTQNESNTIHKSLFDAISSTQRATNMTSTQNLESDD
ncbi:unnamed protein product, partial [Adineta steineri]